MAGDSTISGLAAGVTPSGTELVPVVQGGVTVKLTTAQIAALAVIGAVPNFSDFAVPTGSINGANTSFILPVTPNPSTSCWGVILGSGVGAFLPVIQGYNFTLAGANVTMTIAPPTGSILLFSFRH